MTKIVIHGIDAITKLQSGVNKVADAVKVTLGPGGRNVAIKKDFSNVITKDGVSVAKEIDLEDPVENFGADLIKDVSKKTVEECGDGTTTATLLTQSIFNEGVKYLLTRTVNPISMKRGIDKAVDLAVEYITANSKSVSTDLEIEQVATLSANGDSSIGEVVREAFQRVNRDGMILVENSLTDRTYVEVVDGIHFNRGYVNHNFVTNQSKMTVELDDVLILITNMTISGIMSIVPLLEKVVRANKSLLIICEDIENDVLAGLILNKIKGILKVCVVKAPEFGERRNQWLDDIAILTGGTFLDKEIGHKLDQHVDIEHLGKAKRVIVSSDRTVIYGAGGNPTLIKQREESIKEMMEKTESSYEYEKLNERLNKLFKGVAIIRVGGKTELEQQERKDRFEDSVGATRAAIAEGIVPGGGTTFIRTSLYLKSWKESNKGSYDTDFWVGFDIVIRALESVTRQIARNAGVDDGYVVSVIKANEEFDYGWNARTGDFENLIESGVIDPAKVLKSALINSSSIASMLLTTDCIVVPKPRESKEE